MTTKEHFPDDWIAPGEFTFSSDGMRLIAAKNPYMDYALKGCDNPSPSEIHSKLTAVRVDIAARRRDTGCRRLFWMKDA